MEERATETMAKRLKWEVERGIDTTLYTANNSGDVIHPDIQKIRIVCDSEKSTIQLYISDGSYRTATSNAKFIKSLKNKALDMAYTYTYSKPRR